ncbi:MAG: hypothetical protein K6T80_04420 [Firmicutes bacterium]|nr:hypothetical protein [Bacillota bacterium]
MEKDGFSGISSGRNFPSRALEILALVRERGGMLCTGSCHHQKKEHLHCRQIGKELEMGFSTVWDRINFLLREGLLVRERAGEGPVSFVITPEGENVLRGTGGEQRL